MADEVSEMQDLQAQIFALRSLLTNLYSGVLANAASEPLETAKRLRREGADSITELAESPFKDMFQRHVNDLWNGIEEGIERHTQRWPDGGTWVSRRPS